MDIRNKNLSLFLSFLKIGLFTFGGGYAMIAFLERECVEKRQWINEEEFTSLVAIAESTPGPIAINAATYIGYKMSKMLGALLATTAIILPSFTIIFVISLFFDAFLSLEIVGYAFKGIQVCVVYLILSAGIKMLKKMKKTKLGYLLFGATLIGMLLVTLFSVKLSTILFILTGASIGVACYVGKQNKEREDKK